MVVVANGRSAVMVAIVKAMTVSGGSRSTINRAEGQRRDLQPNSWAGPTYLRARLRNVLTEL